MSMYSLKSRSSTVTDKQESVSLNITSVNLSAFVDFTNIFIRCRSSELSLTATEMVKISFLQNENLNKFCRCLLKTYNLCTF